jgi:hypothetical protein
MKGFVDNNLVLSDAQTIATAAGNSALASSNTLRLPESALGDGRPIYLNVMVATAAAGRSAGAKQLVVRLQDAADSSGSPDTFGSTAVVQTTITVTNLVKGLEILRVALPSDTRAWVRALYNVQTLSAGALDAWLSDH